MKRKPRILFVTMVPPINHLGGYVSFYRQFVLRNDYELFVATDREFDEPGIPYYKIKTPAWLLRVMNSRLGVWAHDYRNLIHGRFVPKELLEQAKAFKPDIVYTVAGTWISLMARPLARKLKVPLAADFIDWSTFSVIGHKYALLCMDKVFRNIYRSCDLAFCTSLGMMEELGPHPNACIHYPIVFPVDIKPSHIDFKKEGRFKLFFAGNLGEWYGSMIERLIKVLPDYPFLDLKIAGANAKWSQSFEDELRSKGIYLGFLSKEKLALELVKADGLLVMMGFDKDAELIEKTSFKTKFIEYATFRKPIIVWGPDYCSAVRMAKKYESALICISPDPLDLINEISILRDRPETAVKYVENSIKMYWTEFDPEKICRMALEKFEEMCK